jgi:hypothetical protein
MYKIYPILRESQYNRGEVTHRVKPKITRPVFMLEGLTRLAPAMRDIARHMPLVSAPAVRHAAVRGYTPLASG